MPLLISRLQSPGFAWHGGTADGKPPSPGVTIYTKLSSALDLIPADFQPEKEHGECR